MNKVVPSIIAMSVLLITAGCSGVKGNAYSGVSANHAAYSSQSSRVAYQDNANHHAGGSYSTQGGQYQQAACQNCGQGSRAVAHDHGHSRATTGQTVTHRHAGVSGHGHNGMSGSHSYVTSTAGRNGGAYVANNGGYAVNNGYVSSAARGAAVRTGSGVGSTIAKAAGALLIGGLIYKVADNNDGGSGGSTGGGNGK